MTDALAIERLLEVLTLERLDDNLFRGDGRDNGRGRSFGGQVAAQSVMAAIDTVDADFALHSMHSYFLLPGDPTQPIIYDVQRIRDGRSFATRRVAARQHGHDIFYLTSNFHRHEEGLEHHDAMPAVGGPDEGIDFAALLRSRTDHESRALAEEWAVVDARRLTQTQGGLAHDPDQPARQQIWLRINGPLPADPKIQLGAFVWMSDISLLGASLAGHTVDPTTIQMASLDHSIWFHRPFRADEWWLYDQHSPAAQNGRGLALGRVFTLDGMLTATVAQEGLIRPPR